MSDSGSSGPSNAAVLILLAAIIIAGIYVWYRHSKDPNWNPYNANSLTSPSLVSPTPERIFP